MMNPPFKVNASSMIGNTSTLSMQLKSDSISDMAVPRPPKLNGYKARRDEEDELDKMVDDILKGGNQKEQVGGGAVTSTFKRDTNSRLNNPMNSISDYAVSTAFDFISALYNLLTILLI